jgi:hypothetical protein
MVFPVGYELVHHPAARGALQDFLRAIFKEDCDWLLLAEELILKTVDEPSFLFINGCWSHWCDPALEQRAQSVTDCL